MDYFSSKKSAILIFCCIPAGMGLLAFFLNSIYNRVWNLFFLTNIIIIFFAMSGSAVLLSLFYYSKKSPIIGPPPKGWALQLNAFLCLIVGGSYLIGIIISIFLRSIAFQEVFFMLGTIVSYIIAYVIYFSFTTAGKYGNLILALIQPVVGIIFYSVLTGQSSIFFFLRAIIFFIVCAIIFAIPYRRSMARVSNIYRQVTGIGGYPFIRAFVLSMMTDGNDDLIEGFFDQVGIDAKIKIQYLAIRSTSNKKIKGLMLVPDVHFGPFKTCGSSDLPAHIYEIFSDIPGTTVYHTTNDHSKNLTTQKEVDKVIDRIKSDVNAVIENSNIDWIPEIKNVTRKISNSAKLIGTEIDNIPIMFLTRHPMPSDDIQDEIGIEIRDLASSMGYKDVIVIDSHNSIIGDEIAILKDSIEGKDLVEVGKKFLESRRKEETQNSRVHYGVAKDPLKEYSEKDGIGTGGLVVHLFKNMITGQKSVFIHFDANNAYVDIRSYILNMLQNKGIEKGEITTSDSHIVARKFTQRGYSPVGDKIKLDYILKKLDKLITEADNNAEEVEFYYFDSEVESVRIWGDPKYFELIMNMLQECLRVSQRLLTYSLIFPTFFSLILLLFYYTGPFAPL